MPGVHSQVRTVAACSSLSSSLLKDHLRLGLRTFLLGFSLPVPVHFIPPSSSAAPRPGEPGDGVSSSGVQGMVLPALWGVASGELGAAEKWIGGALNPTAPGWCSGQCNVVYCSKSLRIKFRSPQQRGLISHLWCYPNIPHRGREAVQTGSWDRNHPALGCRHQPRVLARGQWSR